MLFINTDKEQSKHAEWTWDINFMSP